MGNRLLGQRVHTAQEAWYGYRIPPDAALRVLYADAIQEWPEWEADLRSEWDMASAMTGGYAEWVAETGADSGIEVIATEADVRVPLPGLDGVELRARLDQMFRRTADGAVGFLDWKTSASFDAHEVLALNPQMRLYSLISRLAAQQDHSMRAAAGGVITTLRRVKRTSRSQPPYYQRDEFWYTPQQMDATWRRARRICTEIVGARRQLDEISSRQPNDPVSMQCFQREVLHPTPIASDCRWSCPLVSGVCAAMDDGSDWMAMLARSGRFIQGDPYAYYSRSDIERVLSSGTVSTAQGDDASEQHR